MRSKRRRAAHSARRRSMIDTMRRRQALALLGAAAFVPAMPRAADALHYDSLEAVASRIKARTQSPVTLTQQMLDRIAHAVEQATSWHTRHPPAFA
jgi:hypothetical protein